MVWVVPIKKFTLFKIYTVFTSISREGLYLFSSCANIQNKPLSVAQKSLH